MHLPDPDQDDRVASSTAEDVSAARARGRLLVAAVVLVALVVLAGAWAWSPLRQWLAPQTLIAFLHATGAAVGPVPAALGIAVALSLAVPLTPLTVVVLLAFDPLEGVLCVLAGALLAAVATHSAGVVLGRDAVRRLGGPRVQRLSEWLGRRGLATVLFIRFVPMAPFAIVNLMAGASHIRLRDMIIGTVLGMLPGLLALAFFIEQIQAVLKNPGPAAYATLGATVVFIVAALWWARRWIKRRMPSPEDS